jgi:hypothetical protein
VTRSLRLWIIVALTVAMSHTIARCGTHGEFIGNDATVKSAGDGMSAEVVDGLRYKEQGGRSWTIPPGTVVESKCFPSVLLDRIGRPFVGSIRNASLLYNYFCLNQTRERSDVNRMFREAMLASGMEQREANVLYNAIERFGPGWKVAGIDPACLRPDGRPDFAKCTQDSGVKKQATLTWPAAGPEELKEFESKFGGGGSACSNASQTPTYFLPWPPPRATSKYSFPQRALSDFGTLGAFNDALQTRLRAAGFYDFSYFLAPGGFALATPIERIDSEGYPAADSSRWKGGNTPVGPTRFSDWVRKVLYDEEGYFRVFVFIVTTDSRKNADKSATFEEASNWAANGCRGLPAKMRTTKIGSDQMFYALAYVFSSSKGKSSEQLSNFGASISQQFANTGIKF